MKVLFRLPLTVIALATVAFFGSCKKDSTNPTTPVTPPTALQNFISADTSLSVFNAAIQRAGNSTLYAGTDSVTILAPTNDAFRAQGITTTTINSMSATAVDSLLRYHFIDSSSHLTAGSYTSFNSKLGPVIYGYGNTDGSSNYFNGSLAVKQTISGSNATLYKLSAPLQIPYTSTDMLFASDSSLTYFAEAVKHSGISLTPAGASQWNTILAPTNSAFIAAGYPTLASIDSVNASTLNSIIQYHIIPGQYFTNSFNGLTTVGSSEGNNIGLTFNNGMAQFTGTSNTTAAGITTSNRLAGSNTIVQNINGVLMK
jgi:uncharacterized surface protein with fasciclin (FAS1) repeats